MTWGSYALEWYQRLITSPRPSGLSPTVLRIRGNRFYLFSREEPRAHVHVQYANGEAKLWLEPEVEFAQNHGLSVRRLATVVNLAREHRDEIQAAWRTRFGP